MAVYFFDKEQRVSKILTDNNTLSSIQTQELSDDLLIDYLTVSMTNNENVTDSEYMAVKAHEGNAQTFDMYRVTNVVTQNEITTFTGIQLAYYELAGYVVEDIRPTNQEVATVATQIVAGTEWRVGYVAPSLKRVTTNFYYISAKEAFSKLQEVANCEVVFKVEISGTGVTDKWVEIYKQLGDKTLKRFNYGSKALTIEREIGKNDIYTALIGLGKGEEVGDGYGRKINFSDIEWKKAAGKPVNKLKGKKYVELPEATAEFGIKTRSGMNPRVGIIDFGDIEDKEELLQATYDALLDSARPKVHFKTTVLNIGATNIGDTVTIHRHDLDIHYMARVFKVVRDKLNDDLTQIELGDAVSQSSTKKQSQVNKMVGSLQNKIETDINYVLSTADGKNAINYGNTEPEQKRTGDLWFRDHPSLAGERQMLVWDGNAWIIVLDTSDVNQVGKKIEDIIAENILREKEFRDRMNMTDAELLAFEKKLAELDFGIDNIVIDSISPDVVMGAIKNAGFGQAVDDIRNKVNSNSDTLNTTVTLVGNNGTQTYNKNRTTLTELEIPFGVDKKTIAHNGDGFEVGQPYTVSFAARLIERGNSRVIFDMEVIA